MQESINVNNGFSIKIENISKSFDDFQVLNKISFNIAPGESIAILGQSGTGKSVLLKILGLLLEADSGSLKIDNREMVGAPESEKQKVIKKIGFLFQNSGLFEIPLWENVCFKNIYLDKKPNLKELKAQAFELLELLEIRKDAFELYPSEISGGMQKRVALARILKQEPSLILLDEPDSGLDPITADKMNQTFTKTQNNKKITNITITHDIKIALSRDRILVLKSGHFIWSGTPNEFINSSEENQYIKNFIETSTI